jgi:hypothetical protein
MPRVYEPYIPKSIIDIKDLIACIILWSPKFLDTTGYFPDQNIDTVFYALNEGLRLMQQKFDEETYLKLRDLSDRARACFEADPDDKADGRRKGCALIYELEDLLKKTARKRRSRSQ